MGHPRCPLSHSVSDILNIVSVAKELQAEDWYIGTYRGGQEYKGIGLESESASWFGLQF